MNRYIVIRRDSIQELEAAVNAYISQKGYEPMGGIQGVNTNVHHLDRTETLWCQALWLPKIDL